MYAYIIQINTLKFYHFNYKYLSYKASLNKVNNLCNV